MVWNYRNADCSLKNKLIMSFVIIFGTLSFSISFVCDADWKAVVAGTVRGHSAWAHRVERGEFAAGVADSRVGERERGTARSRRGSCPPRQAGRKQRESWDAAWTRRYRERPRPTPLTASGYSTVLWCWGQRIEASLHLSTFSQRLGLCTICL